VLTVTDSAGATSSDTLEIAVGSSPPQAEILTPGEGAKFRIGDTVNFAGRATDAEDGELGGADLQWTVNLHHLEHIHYDFFNGEGTEGSFRFDDHGDDTYLEVCLTASDMQGLEDSACVDIKAEEVTYTFTSVPAGQALTYAGSRYETPFKVQTYINAKRIIEAPPETDDGLRFDNWSDGGEAVHEIVIGDGAQTLVATYVDAEGVAPEAEAGAAALEDAPLVTPEEPAASGEEGAHTHDDEAGEAPAEEEPAATATLEPASEEAAEQAAEEEAGDESAAGSAVVAERWDGVTGATLEEFTRSDGYRKQAAGRTFILERLELPRTGDKDYGVRIRGYLLPPADGEYRFWIAADDRAALYLSSDATPDNKIVIAYTPQSTNAGEYEKNPEQITGPITLEAGERYYFEVLYKQGDGRDNLSIAWQPPGEERAVIDGAFLAEFVP
jgi:hypothetical protein